MGWNANYWWVQRTGKSFFPVEEFLDLYEDPFQHFSDETRPTDEVKKKLTDYFSYKNA